MSAKLMALIEKAKLYEMSPDEIEEQRIHFAYGNASYEDRRVTIDGVMRSSVSLRGDTHARAEVGID